MLNYRFAVMILEEFPNHPKHCASCPTNSIASLLWLLLLLLQTRCTRFTEDRKTDRFPKKTYILKNGRGEVAIEKKNKKQLQE